VLWEKLQFGLVRYFDADEMAYLHWAHSVFTGSIPYRDFLSYIPPGYYYALAPLYWISHGTEILQFGRIHAFIIFAGIAMVSTYLFWLVRKSWIALLSGIFVAFIPIPADKYIEIRPDNLATFVALLGAVFHIVALEKGLTRRYWFMAGVLYMSSLFILPKALPQAVVGVCITMCWWMWGDHSRRERHLMALIFAAGFILPVLAFGVWIAGTMKGIDQLNVVLYSLIRLPLEVNKIGALFPMQPYQFFYPNALVYGAGGWNVYLFANHILWFVGLLVGAVRLVTPALPNGRKGIWAELLVGLSFFGYTALFIYGYPMRHEQYLIPIAVFVSWYAADGLHMLWMNAKDRIVPYTLFCMGVVMLLYGVFFLSNGLHDLKKMHTNAGDYRILREAIRLIPNDAYVFDLVGSTIYFRDPYYVSAVPFGQWEPYLSRPLPSLRDALARTQAGFVYEGQLRRTEGLSPADKAYITSHFRPTIDVGGLLSR